MTRIKTLIVEDELIIAEDIKEMLVEMGHDVIGIASDISEAENILSEENPDIALIDIQLRGKDDGIELASIIRNKLNIPLIFITSYSDKATVDRAKQVMPNGYIVKPFEKADLYTAIEIALYNFAGIQRQEQPREEMMNVVVKDSIFIRKDYMLIKIRFEDLMWITSELNYLELHCRETRHLIRSTLKEFLEKLPSDMFIQVHKSYCINIRYITAIEHSRIWLGTAEVPIGRNYLDAVKKILNLEI